MTKQLMKAKDDELLGLKRKEYALLMDLINPTTRVQVIETASQDPEVYWQQLSVCCQAMNNLKDAQIRLRPIIGKFLLIAQKNPLIYTSRGYKTFEEFITEGVCNTLHLSRTEAYQSKRIASMFPDLTPEDVVEIGTLKMDILCRALKGKDDPRYVEALGMAKMLPVEEFRTYMIHPQMLDEVDRGTVRIITTKAIAEEWGQFVARPEVVAACQSSDHGVILRCMMAECLSEWTASYNEYASSRGVNTGIGDEDVVMDDLMADGLLIENQSVQPTGDVNPEMDLPASSDDDDIGALGDGAEEHGREGHHVDLGIGDVIADYLALDAELREEPLPETDGTSGPKIVPGDEPLERGSTLKQAEKSTLLSSAPEPPRPRRRIRLAD